MSITGIFTAALVVAVVGIFVGLFWELQALNLKFRWTKRKKQYWLPFPAIIAADAAMRAVPVWRRPLQKEKLP